MLRCPPAPPQRVLRLGAVVSVLVVALSVAVHFVAYRLQVTSPDQPAIAALQWFDVSSERNVRTA